MDEVDGGRCDQASTNEICTFVFSGIWATGQPNKNLLASPPFVAEKFGDTFFSSSTPCQRVETHFSFRYSCPPVGDVDAGAGAHGVAKQLQEPALTCCSARREHDDWGVTVWHREGETCAAYGLSEPWRHS